MKKEVEGVYMKLMSNLVKLLKNKYTKNSLISLLISKSVQVLMGNYDLLVKENNNLIIV